jgi:hypothetical protein
LILTRNLDKTHVKTPMDLAKIIGDN